MEKNNLTFTCTQLKNGGTFPTELTGRGQDISPEFIIKNLSPRAVTLIITLEDLSHPIKRFTHWIIWNLPAAQKITKAIPAGRTVPSLGGAQQGIAYGFHRYAGPKPPGGKTHKYCFTIYVLDCKLHLNSFAAKRKVLRRAKGHVIQQGEFCAYYQ